MEYATNLTYVYIHFSNGGNSKFHCEHAGLSVKIDEKGYLFVRHEVSPESTSETVYVAGQWFSVHTEKLLVHIYRESTK